MSAEQKVPTRPAAPVAWSPSHANMLGRQITRALLILGFLLLTLLVLSARAADQPCPLPAAATTTPAAGVAAR